MIKTICTPVCPLLLMLALITACTGQNQTDGSATDSTSGATAMITSRGPKGITRNIIQDSKGNIWIAAFDGVFRYDGKSFTNMAQGVSSARFFSVLEDRQGNFWFSTVGSGVYYYDGKSFRHFTTKDGLADDRVMEIHEDRTGNVWFSTLGGASRYDGQSFRNFTKKDGLPSNDVNAIMEDRTGKFWFASRLGTGIYDGTGFSVITHEDKPFRNVRSIIEDSKGNIWLGGDDGLWRHDGMGFTNFSTHFVGFIYEDKKGNIWVSTDVDNIKGLGIGTFSMRDPKRWVLARYPENSLANPEAEPETITKQEEMIFGILEADDGSIWYGTLNGVYRYDGNMVTEVEGKEITK